MNTNNRNNNRRRGRGNRQNNGGGQQLNRIDSRARGNAPQLLEKYRKLAHDAHLNGDRVQAEYYLQFADHYFRVLADQRQRQEEQRARRDDRWEGGSEGFRDESEDGGDFTNDGDFPTFDQPNTYTRRDREERGEWQRREREERDERDDRPVAPAEDAEDEDRSMYEPPENPFVRGERSGRGLRPRRDPRQARDERPRRESGEEAPTGLDPSILPPPISVASDDAEEAEVKPRRGRPRKKPSADDAGEALESVS